jgi:hypothetical protein
VAGSAFAGRPLAIDDADPVDVGQFEFEAGAAYEYDSDCKHWDVPFGLTYGLLSSMEIGVGFGGQLEVRSEHDEDSGTEQCIREHGIGDLSVGAKWQFMESCPLGARHALAASVKFPTSDEDKGLGSGETDYDLTWIASRDIGEKAGAHLNLGHSWLGGTGDGILHAGIALDYQMMDSVQWVGEVFAERAWADGADIGAQYNTGFRWNPVESLSVDMAAGSKICGDVPDFTATVGLTWAFGSTE